MPTQNDEYWFVEEHEPCMLGTIHEPLASVTLLVGPVTAKPLQFVLVTLSWLRRRATRSWGVGSALATVRKVMTMTVVARNVLGKCRGNKVFSCAGAGFRCEK